jgi:hypothetical protein
VIDGWRYFGYRPAEGESDVDMGRRHAEVFLDLLRGEGFVQPNPRPMFSNPPELLRVEPVGCVRTHEAAVDKRHARQRERNILSIHESDSRGRIVGRHSLVLSIRSVMRKPSVGALSTLGRQAIM